MRIFFNFTMCLTACLILVLARCGGTSQVDNSPLPVARGGQSVSTPVSQYEDFAPTISALGKRIVFVSTRTQVGAIFPRRLWKSTFTSTVGSSAPVRVLNSDVFDDEQEPVLSADGTFVLFKAKKGQAISIVLAKFDDPGFSQVVASSFLSPPKYTFSQDSSLFAFVVSANSAQSVLGIASVANPAIVYSFTVSGESISGLFWIATASGYQLGWSSSTLGFDRNISSLNFANLSALSTSTKQLWLTGVGFDDQSFNTNGSFMTAAVKISPDGSKTVPPLGNVVTPTVFNRRNEVQIFNFPGVTPVSFSNYTPMSVRFRYVSLDSTSVFALGLFPVQCPLDPNPQYQNIISVFNGTTETKIIPRTATVANTWEISADPCLKKHADGSDGILDTQISNFMANANATAQNFVALYVTNQSGDQEVRAIETLVGVSKIYEVSNNKP